MDARDSIKLAMASRVLEFSRIHPSALPGYAEALAQLEGILARARTLMREKVVGHVMERASSRGKNALRAIIRDRYLTHLVRIGQAAAATYPDFRQCFRLPARTSRESVFLGICRDMALRAEGHKWLFLKDGMPATFVEDLNGFLAEYEHMARHHVRGIEMHTVARAELREVTGRLMLLVKRFDAINMLRFAADPAILAVWMKARTVEWAKAGAEPGAQHRDLEPAA